MTVNGCMACLEDNTKVVVLFDGGLSRIFNLEGIEETLAKEEFYKELDKTSKMTIALGIMCCRGGF